MATTSTDPARVWQERIEKARAGRKPFEPGWLLNLAFAAGQHWLVWDRRQSKLRRIQDVDPRYRDRELYTADRITEYRDAQLGELQGDDDRPQLLAVQTGDTAEQATAELNQAVGYAWEHEWAANDALRQARRFCVDLGVAAMRCHWNPDIGKTVGHVPIGQNGQPVAPDGDVVSQLQLTGQLPDGSLPRFRPVKEGQTEWRPYSGFQLLTPPGYTHEDDFPWEILVDVVQVDDLVGVYGDLAAGLSEDADIASAIGVTTFQQASTGQPSSTRLTGCVWRYTCFQRPNRRNPQGAVAVVASNRYVLLEQRQGLDYRTPAGEPHTGVVYLHWRRRSDRFWSGGMIDNLKDPQRLINRRESQNLEIIDRGLPKVYIKKSSVPQDPTGAPMEMVVLPDSSSEPPVFSQGLGPGQWMYEDLAHHADNLSHASTLSPLRLGENPQNVDTYSQLALLNENEAVKRSVQQIEHRAAIATLTELSVLDMQRYWQPEKQILVAGEDDQIRQAVFQKSRIPAFFMAKVAQGAPLPRGQAAQLKKVDAIWAAALQCGWAVQQPQQWTAWYTDSLEAGKPLDLPEPESDSQERMAEFENLLMRQGEQPPVMDYDLAPTHLPKHREAMDEARAANDTAWLVRLDQHVQAHVRAVQVNAALAAQAQQTATPAATNGTSNPAAPFIAQDFQRLAAGNP